MENFFVQCVSAKLTGKHLCQNFIKNVSLEHVFSCEFCTLVLSVGGADSLQWIFPHAFFLYISKTNLVLRAILLKSRKLENQKIPLFRLPLIAKRSYKNSSKFSDKFFLECPQKRSLWYTFEKDYRNAKTIQSPSTNVKIQPHTCIVSTWSWYSNNYAQRHFSVIQKIQMVLLLKKILKKIK